VRYLLDTHPCMRLVAPPVRLGGPGLARPADAGALRAAVAVVGAAAAAGCGRRGAVGEREDEVDESADQNATAAPSAAAPSAAVAAPSAAVAAAKAATQIRPDADLPAGGAWLSHGEAALVQRFDPADADLDTIGFFAARFVKD
jgi:hypothetical protein